jgi:hypothetical protein
MRRSQWPIHADRDRDLLVLDESHYYPYIEEPDRHFQNAHQAFLAKDYEKTAQEIRKGEAWVKIEAGRASGDVKHSLNSSAQELEKLATDTEKGTVKTSRTWIASLAAQIWPWRNRTKSKRKRVGRKKRPSQRAMR